MKKFIKNIALIASAALAVVGCTPEPAEVIDGIALNRCLTPTNLEAEIVASVGTDVELTWDVMKGTEFYTVEVYESTQTTTNEEGEEVAVAPDFDATEPFKTETNITEVPHTVSGLEVDKSYFVRVKGHATNVEDSHWAVLEEAFATSAVRSSFKLSVLERTSNSVTISWSEGEDAADLTTLRATPVSDNSKKSVDTPLSAEVIAARTIKVEGLEPCTDYKFTLIYGKACQRGSVTAWTRPSTEDANYVNTVDGLVNAITGTIGDVKIHLAYNDGVAYDLSAVAAISCNFYLYGETTNDGKKPVITGLDIQPATADTFVHLEDVVLDGAVYAVAGAETKGHIVTNKVGMAGFELINSEVFGYTKGLYSSSGAGAGIGTFLLNGVYAHDINPTGSVGGDFIDFRGGHNPSIVVKNSTFYACARTFLRLGVDNSQTVGDVEVSNCTFNFVCSTATSSNNNGVFHVMVGTEAKKVVSKKNVFLNMYSDTEPAGAEFVRLARNSTQNYAPVCEGNYYYNVGPAFLVSAANVIGTGEAITEASDGKDTATGGTILTDAVLNGGGVILEVDPCQSSGAGKFYLNNTSDIATKQAGDPRWWNAAIPEPPVRATDLEVVSEPYVWNFTDKKVYDGEELAKTTIIGNARIYASAEAPSVVVLGEGIYFAEAGMVDADGVPTHGAVGILTNGYGAVVVTAEGANGVEGVQVLAGGDRYTLLADGEPHKVLLGDLSGDNNIYVMAAGGVTLKSIEWTKDLTADATATALKTPAVAFDNRKVDEGTEMAVTASWAAIENADHYEITWRGTTTEQTALSFTIDAASVAALAVGEYDLSVVAVPVATSSKWLRSEAGVATLQVNKVVVGGEKTLTWDFSSEVWANALTEIGTSDNTTADVTVDGLRVLAGGQKIKAGSNYIQMGGGAKNPLGTNRSFIFTAPASGTLKVWSSNTGSSEDLTRMVSAMTGTAEAGDESTKQSNPGGTPSNADHTVSEFDIDITTAGDVVYIFPEGNGLRFYKIEYTYVEATKAEYIWNFSDEIWETQVFDWLAPLGSDGSTDMDVTVDGLRIVAGGKNVRGYLDENVGNYIQPNGGGSTSTRCFSFTAPGDGTVKVKVSNTGGSEDLARLVCVQVGDDASTLQEIAGGFPSSTPDFIEFDITASNQTVYIYPNKGLRFYQIEYHQN